MGRVRTFHLSFVISYLCIYINREEKKDKKGGNREKGGKKEKKDKGKKGIKGKKDKRKIRRKKRKNNNKEKGKKVKRNYILIVKKNCGIYLQFCAPCQNKSYQFLWFSHFLHLFYILYNCFYYKCFC